MPLTAAERRARRRAVAHSSARREGRTNSSVDSDSDCKRWRLLQTPTAMDSDSDGTDDSDSDGDSDSDDSDSDHSDIDGADDSDSDGADDAFAAEPNEGARSPVASPGGGAGGSRGAALADSASHEFSDGDAAAACSALCGSAVCCGIASVHCSCCTTVACVHLPQPQPHLMHVWARFPCPISSCWREQPHAALPSHSCPLLSECGKRACAQACKQWTSS
jgi:hypothetical protein